MGNLDVRDIVLDCPEGADETVRTGSNCMGVG